MKTKTFLITGVLCLIGLSVHSQMGNYVHAWALSVGADKFESGEAIVTTSDGYMYNAGSFQETVDFDPYSPAGSVTSHGHTRDVYLCKRDQDGHFEWVKSFGGMGHSDVVAIDTDSEFNIYLTGRFFGTVDFDPDPTSSFTMTNISSGPTADVYVSKFDKNGNFIWAKQLRGTGVLCVQDLTIDKNNNVHVTGCFAEQLDVDPSPYNSILKNTSGVGDDDGYCVTLDENGIYKKSFHLKGSSSNTIITSVAIDASLNQYFTGDFEGTCDFNPGSGPFSTFNLSSTGTGQDAFIVKVSPLGMFQWAKQLETSSAAYSESIKLDGSGNIYTAGSFWGSIDLDPGVGSNLHIKASGSHAYINKLNSSGNFIYGKTISGTSGGSSSTSGDVFASDFFVTSSGKVFLTGSYNNTVDFNPGIGTAIRTATGNTGGFTCGLNSFGNFLMVHTVESFSGDYVYNNAITLNNSEDIYTTGYFLGMADFNPTGYPYYRISNGNYDMFTHKIELQTLEVPFPNWKSNESISDEIDLEVYPNPTSNFVNFNLPGDEIAEVSLISVNGKVLYSAEHDAGLSTINLENLGSGTYILLVVQGERTQKTKVIKR